MQAAPPLLSLAGASAQAAARESRLPKGTRLGSRRAASRESAGGALRGAPAPEALLCPGRYFNIERGKNMCGLADCASFPVPLL